MMRIGLKRLLGMTAKEDEMGRHSKSHSYGHRIARLDAYNYRLFWTVDRYYAGSRLRYPTGYSRDADTAGAERFAKRWNVVMPNTSLTGGEAVRVEASVGRGKD